jgi:hypothetical protein
MIEWTSGGGGDRFGPLVLHDDPARELACGPALGMRRPPMGAFTRELTDQAKASGWTVASVKDDRAQVLPNAPSSVTAIDILLGPDAAMVARAQADDASPRDVVPKGFALDATDRPDGAPRVRSGLDPT